MIALDTNVLARLLLQDDVAQFKRAKALFASGQTFTAPVTVLLELVWVLESNDCTPAEIQSGIQLLLGLPNFKPPETEAVREALRAYSQGMDFADALHLALCRSSTAFMTFDKAFAKRAAKAKTVPPVSLA